MLDDYHGFVSVCLLHEKAMLKAKLSYSNEAFFYFRIPVIKVD